MALFKKAKMKGNEPKISYERKADQGKSKLDNIDKKQTESPKIFSEIRVETQRNGYAII